MSYSVSRNYDPTVTEPTLKAAEAHIDKVKTSQELPPTTVLIVDSGGSIARFYSTKRITGEYLKKEASVDIGDSVFIVDRAAFDATESVLLLSASEIIALADDESRCIEIAHRSGVEWDGPADVLQDTFIESICEFFALDKIEDLTQERLEAAVQGIYGGIVEETVDLVIKVSVRRFKETSCNDFVEGLEYVIVSKTPGAVVTDTEIIDA